MHVAVALDPVGGLLGVREFPTSAAGYDRLLGWSQYGQVTIVTLIGSWAWSKARTRSSR